MMQKIANQNNSNDETSLKTDFDGLILQCMVTVLITIIKK